MGCLHNKYTLPTFSHTHMHSPVHTHAQMLSHTHTLPHIHTLGAHKHSLYTHTLLLQIPQPEAGPAGRWEEL